MRGEHSSADVDRGSLLAGAAHAAGIGSFSWDLTSGRLVWDEPLLEAFGYDDSSFGGTIEAFSDRLHPEDRPRVDAALQHAIDTCGEYRADFRVVRPDGSVRWMSASGVVQGADGEAQRLIGAATDVTGLREQGARTHGVLESMSVGYLALDRDWRIVFVNAEGRRVLGGAGPDLVGNVLWELFPSTVGTEYEVNYRRAVETGEVVSFDAYYPAPLDAWYELRATPEADGMGLYFLDITARRNAQAASEREARRANLLASVARELADDLDPATSLLAVLRLLVPALGDWAIASVLDEGTSHWRQRLHDVTCWHPDPDVRDVAEQYRGLRVDALTENSPVGVALATQRPATTDRAGRSAAGDLLVDGPAHRLLQQLNPYATVVLPLSGRGHVRGLITVVNGEPRGAFTDEDIATLQEVTSQVGLALDNAHLHAVQRGFAEQLQHSLLTELPEPDHLELVARYAPAADGAQVGGDWYDAFLVRDGSTCLVIGDVTGHDQEAAVQMAQVRNVLRGVAHAVIQPPAAILHSLDWAMRDLAVGALTTCVLAKVEQPATDVARGVRTLRWSNAGHLPPLLVHPDGTTELLEHPHDLLLGMGVDVERQDHAHVLEDGVTVVLYTDGLVERRGEHLDTGLRRLRDTATTLAGKPLGEFCDELVQVLAPGSEDDIAVLALRAHSESGPRPDEAGPQRLPDDLVASTPTALGENTFHED